MTTFVTDVLAAAWLESLRDTQVYASLHIERPSSDNPSASEVSGATYGRVPVTWTLLGVRAIGNEDPLQWFNLEQTSIGAVGLFTDPYQGVMLLSMTLDSVVPVPERGSFEIGSGDLVVTM